MSYLQKFKTLYNSKVKIRNFDFKAYNLGVKYIFNKLKKQFKLFKSK